MCTLEEYGLLGNVRFRALREQAAFAIKEAFVYFIRTVLLNVSRGKGEIGEVQFAEEYTEFRLRSLHSEYF
jgi:hypothetical protein